MSCFENCERDWLLGARGVCNATINGTLECICPEFYSGNDDWERFNDSCQVDERIQKIVHIVIVVLIGVSCLFIAASILFFACETGFATMPEVPENVRGSIAFTRQFGTAESSSSRTIVKPNGEVAKPQKQKRLSLIAPPENIPSREQKLGHRVWFRQRGTLLSFLLFLLSSISAFLYYVPFLFGSRRSDIIDPDYKEPIAYVQNFGLALAAPSLLAGFFMQVKAWYTSLPNVQDYGTLFEMNRFITRYPNLIYYVSNVGSIVVFIASFVFVFILPIVFPELYQLCNLAVLALFITSILMYFAVMTVVLVSVKGLLREYVKADEREEKAQGGLREDEARRLKNFKQAIVDCNILLALVWIGGMSVIVALGIALSSEGRRYSYLTFNAVGVLAFICTSLMVGLISTQTSGGLTPKYRPTQRTTINSSMREGITS